VSYRNLSVLRLKLLDGPIKYLFRFVGCRSVCVTRKDALGQAERFRKTPITRRAAGPGGPQAN
jgi:hypothetical protein